MEACGSFIGDGPTWPGLAWSIPMASALRALANNMVVKKNWMMIRMTDTPDSRRQLNTKITKTRRTTKNNYCKFVARCFAHVATDCFLRLSRMGLT